MIIINFIIIVCSFLSMKEADKPKYRLPIDKL